MNSSRRCSLVLVFALGIASAVALWSCGASSFAASAEAPATVLENGLWFDGETFVPRTVAFADGRFIEPGLRQQGRVVDLEGGFVVPPFGEAHHHAVVYFEDRVESFMRQGVFYVKVQAVDIESGRRARRSLADVLTLDVSLAMGGLTASDGHPAQIGFRIFRDATSVEEFDGKWVHLIDSPDDLEGKWPAIVASEPDFLKIFLLNSEDYALLAGDDRVAMRYRGLDPALAGPIVERAQASGLRVSSHVRTAADFRTAVLAGVDEIAHLPGFAIGPSDEDEAEFQDARLVAELDQPERFKITMADARQAAARGLIVVTTVGPDVDIAADQSVAMEALYRKANLVRREVCRYNLQVLKTAGVEIVIGSDAGEGSSVGEAKALSGLGVFTPLELLRMLSQATPRMIFPERRVGCLEVGCEASFLLLTRNPLESFDAIDSIERRFKEGHELAALEP